ncbi:MAG: hypothetical protein ACQEXQ_17720 [Bacillota bacterium]
MNINKLATTVLLIAFITVGCSNGNDGKPSDQEQQDILQLSFKQTAVTQLLPKNANEDWTVTKEIKIRDTAIILYEDGSRDGYALAKHAGKFYDLGGVYNVENIKTQMLEGPFGDIELIGGIGTDLTSWEILGMYKQSGNLMLFQTIGRPEMIDLEGDGSEEMIASFNGAHLNFPNVEILRLNGSEIESAEMVDQTSNSEDQKFARVLKKSGDVVFEIGKVREDGTERQFTYENGQLVAD